MQIQYTEHHQYFLEAKMQSMLPLFPVSWMSCKNAVTGKVTISIVLSRVNAIKIIFLQREKKKWLYFIQKEIWSEIAVWLATFKKNIQFNEFNARLHRYVRVVFQAQNWCKRSLDIRLEVYFLLLWMKIFESVLMWSQSQNVT